MKAILVINTCIEFFFQALFFLLIKYSVYYCEDRLHIHFFIRNSHRWFTYVLFTLFLVELMGLTDYLSVSSKNWQILIFSSKKS